MDRITLRRHLHRIVEMRPLSSFQSTTADLDVDVVSVFDDYDRSVVIAFVTGVGTVTVRLPDQLAAELAGGILKLLRAHAKSQQDRGGVTPT
jgi:hypothetical protein